MFGRQHLHEVHLRDGKHVAHTSGGREAAGAFMLVCILCVIFFSSVDVWFLPFWSKIALTLIVGIGCGYVMMNWIGGMDLRNRIKTQADLRESVEAEKQKQIDAMLRKSSNVPKVPRS